MPIQCIFYSMILLSVFSIDYSIQWYSILLSKYNDLVVNVNAVF